VIRKAAVALLLLAATLPANAQPARLDPSELAAMQGADVPDVIVLTFGVGERIFEKFGHAAICLHWRNTGREPVCFNYGVTNFSAGSELVWGFLRGEQKFWLDPERWGATVAFYEYEDRDIWEQTLPLTPEQARAFETKLLGDLDEHHRYYVYDHFFDNCTTRLRDMIDAITGGKLRTGTDVAYAMTFREMGRRGLTEEPELLALTDFLVGRQLDDHPTLWNAMFYPAVLREQLRVHFGAEPTLIYQRKGPPFQTSASFGGRFGMLALAAAFALPLVLAAWRRRFERLALSWAALYLGLWGLALWSLVVVSTIPGLRWNEAALVLVPLDFLLPFLSPRHRHAYAKWRVIELLAVSVLCAIGVLHQPLWIPILTAIVPLATVFVSDELRTRPTPG
jgi:uncharacterized protein DUF4105